MAEMAAVNFKMDRLTKQQMEKVCADLGMNLTTAFNVFAKAVVRANGLPDIPPKSLKALPPRPCRTL